MIFSLVTKLHFVTRGDEAQLRVEGVTKCNFVTRGWFGGTRCNFVTRDFVTRDFVTRDFVTRANVVTRAKAVCTLFNL
jgi:hypothetical protein